MRSLVKFVTAKAAGSSCILSSSLSSSCLVKPSASYSCVAPAPCDSVCIGQGALIGSCLPPKDGELLSLACETSGEASSSCISFPSLSSTCLTSAGLSGSSCNTPSPAPNTACLGRGTASASCIGNPGSDGLSSIKLGPNVNHISWKYNQIPDWLIIRPLYSPQAGSELRSRIGITLKTLKSPASPVYTFPLTEDLSGGFPIAVRALNAVGSALSFVTTAGPVVIPTGTNVETTYPSFVCAYQTDNITGPSEKSLVNLKRLRALGFDTLSLVFSMFNINTSYVTGSVPVQLSLYKGGFPSPVTAGAEVDWNMNGATLLLQEVLQTRACARVSSEATRDPMLTMDISFSQNRLIFFPL